MNAVMDMLFQVFLATEFDKGAKGLKTDMVLYQSNQGALLNITREMQKVLAKGEDASEAVV